MSANDNPDAEGLNHETDGDADDLVDQCSDLSSDVIIDYRDNAGARERRSMIPTRLKVFQVTRFTCAEICECCR